MSDDSHPTPSERQPASHASGIVLLLVALAFGPLLVGQFDFVNLDDGKNIVDNPHFRGLGGEHLAWMFTTHHMGHYQPLSWMSLGLDFEIWGMNATGYHRTNLFLHLANSVLAYVLFTLLLGFVFPDKARPLRMAAAFGALLFAVHPLRVESVAWVTERRDLLSGFFYLLTLILYLRWRQRPELKWRYVFCLLCFVLSLFAKAWGITFCVVLLLLNAYPLRRLGPKRWKKVVVEVLPFLLLALPFVYAAWWAQTTEGAAMSWERHSWAARGAQAAYGLCFYVVKSVWPAGLYPMYELEKPLDPASAIHVSCLVAVVLGSILLLRYRRKLAWLAVSWFAYAVIVAPVLGFAQSGPQKVADRYTYLSCLPFAVVLAGAVLVVHRRCLVPRWVLYGVPCVVLIVLGSLTFVQCDIWRNSTALWEHAVRINPHSHMSLYNLAKAHEDAGRIDTSIDFLKRAIEVRPKETTPRRNLGLLLATKLQFDAAIVEFEKLLRLRPDDAEVHYCIGRSHASVGRNEQARRFYRSALRLRPAYSTARRALAELPRRGERPGEKR